MPRKDFGCVQSVPLLLEEGDRVNAELQRAPAASETRQVGVPPSGGPNATARGDRVNAELQRAPAASETRQVGVPPSGGPNATARGARENSGLLQGLHATDSFSGS
jgi:hypothetical protein